MTYEQFDKLMARLADNKNKDEQLFTELAARLDDIVWLQRMHIAATIIQTLPHLPDIPDGVRSDITTQICVISEKVIKRFGDV